MIRVTIRGSEEVIKQLKNLPLRIQAALLKAMQDSTILIQSLAKINAPVFRGLLRVSIAQSVHQEGNRIVGEVGSALPYADVVESGRNIGWFPPVADLKAWARRKLGDERLGFVIGRAIKRRGFKARSYLTPAVQAAGPRVQLAFANRITEAIKQGGGTA
jgi:hypothetical protein